MGGLLLLGMGGLLLLPAMHFRIIRSFNQKVRNCFLGLFVGYGWFVVVGDGRPGLLLCGLGGLVCCCVAWVAWPLSFIP